MISFGGGSPDINQPSLKPLWREMSRIAQHNPGEMLSYDVLDGARAARANRPPDAGRRLHRRGKRNCHYQRLPRRAVDRPALGVQTGDIVAVESPSFHGTMQMLRGFDIKAIEIPPIRKPGSASKR